ncbi:hypothetical protein QCA50_000978 [Cerrena zonata]|uniref:CxC2-like cysteine cluster KDZ transposase-associated domain-containing protein n=1 Tax=Cerrena zonata TaxID=2478898 RepID=A0AAW0H0N9_9APHY
MPYTAHNVSGTATRKRGRSTTPDTARNAKRSHKRGAPTPITITPSEDVVYHHLVDWVSIPGRKRFIRRTMEAVSPHVLAKHGRRTTRRPIARSNVARNEPEDDTQLRHLDMPSGSENWTFQYEHPKRERKTANAHLRKFCEIRDMLLDQIIAREAPPIVRQCSVCEREAMRWRCHDCFGEPVFCTTCCASQHQQHPFHRVSRWTGLTFTSSALRYTGMVLHLGHGGRPCPLYKPLGAFVAADTITGIPSPHISATQGQEEQQHEDRNHSIPSEDYVSNIFAEEFVAEADDLPALVPLSDSEDEGDRSDLDGDDSDSDDSDDDNPFSKLRPLQESRETSPAADANPFADINDVPDSPGESSAPGGMHTLSDVVNSTPFPTEGIPDIAMASDSDTDDEPEDADRRSTPLRPPRYPKGKDMNGNQWMTLGDITGIHHLPVHYCECNGNRGMSLHNHLIKMGLYGATHDDPHTAFTFRLLDDYNLTNLETKCSAEAYFGKLSRLTFNCFPMNCPDRYRELMRISREWRNLKARRWAGFGYRNAPDPERGGLALFCAACPQPGVNLPQDWDKDSDRQAA